MRERGDLRQQGRLYGLAGDEQLDGLDPGRSRGIDEILTLRGEETQLVAPAPLVQLANELELLVLPRRDQAASFASAAFACSAIAPNAAGSSTARSARTLRSSSIPALRLPDTNWL